MTNSTPIWGNLDANIEPLVYLLRDKWGIDTIGSCGGHRKPKRTQRPEGKWFVSFSVGIEDISRLLALVNAIECTGIKWVSMHLLWLTGLHRVDGFLDGECNLGALVEALTRIEANSTLTL